MEQEAKRLNRRQAKRSSEAGIAMILIAVTVVGLGTLLIVLSIDVLRGKTAFSYAQSFADDICGPAASRLPFVAQAVGASMTKIPAQLTGIGGYMEIKKIRFIAPMIIDNPGGSPLNPYTPAGWTWPKPLSDFGSSCPASVCEFWGDVTVPGPPSPQSFFPSAFMDPADYGELFACVVEMEANTLILGNRYVVAKSAVQLRIRDSIPGANKSVIIALAPQMEVPIPPAGATNRFSLWPTLSGSDPSFVSSPPAPATDPGGPNGSFNTPSTQLTALSAVFGFSGLSFTPLYPSLVPSPLNLMLWAPSHNPNATTLGKREDQYACHNGPTAFRNALLSSWFTRLSRMGSQRFGTQFAIINSRSSVAANPPTVVKAAGIDSMLDPLSDNFILPSVNRIIGTAGGSNRMYCGLSNLWPLPPGFNPALFPPGECDALQRAYVNQLRKCFHVFNDGTTGVSTIRNPSLVNTLGTESFEPPTYADSPEPVRDYIPPDPAVSGDLVNWEQWVNLDKLKLGELTKMIGVEQSCPTQDLPNPNSISGLSCSSKPAAGLTSPPIDPLPDYVAFLRYARGAGQGYHPVGPLWHPDVNVQTSSGVLVTSWSSGNTPTWPNGDIAVGGNNGPNASDIVIVATKPLTPGSPSPDIVPIQTEVDLLHENRSVTVILIAMSREMRNTPSVFNDYNTAFCGGSTARDCQVIVVAPDAHPAYIPMGCGPVMQPNQDACLYSFFNGLLLAPLTVPAWPPALGTTVANATSFPELEESIFNTRIAQRGVAL